MEFTAARHRPAAPMLSVRRASGGIRWARRATAAARPGISLLMPPVAKQAVSGHFLPSPRHIVRSSGSGREPRGEVDEDDAWSDRSFPRGADPWDGDAKDDAASARLARDNPGGIRKELVNLAGPAIIGQAIDPLGQLLETAYIGRLGPVPLASAAVGMSVFNIISKLFNVPLLSVTTSFVAEDVARNDSSQLNPEGNITSEAGERKRLPSISSALLLAAAIGVIEALALILGSGILLNITGVSHASSMHDPARLFLSVRALGAPAVVVSLAIQGVFRGLKDTKTPLLYSGLGNISAAILLPFFCILPELWTNWSCSSNYCFTALIASSLAKLDYKKVKEVTNDVLKTGVFVGVALGLLLFASFGRLAELFSSDPMVLQIVMSGVLFVSASQPINALAFIFDGLHFGVSDFSYSASSMMVVGAISSLFFMFAPRILGLPGVWAGLALFMSLRMAAGFFRLGWTGGPWWFLHQKDLEYKLHLRKC